MLLVTVIGGKLLSRFSLGIIFLGVSNKKVAPSTKHLQIEEIIILRPYILGGGV